MNIDVNSAQCIVKVDNIGESVYTNICNGMITHVPWGTGDYLAVSALSFLIVIMLGLFAFLGFLVLDVLFLSDRRAARKAAKYREEMDRLYEEKYGKK